MVEKLEKIQRNFLWLGGEEKNRLDLLSWEMICKPKSRGGIGIRRIFYLTNVLLSKEGWKVMKDEAKWCRIVKLRYLGNLNLFIAFGEMTSHQVQGFGVISLRIEVYSWKE